MDVAAAPSGPSLTALRGSIPVVLGTSKLPAGGDADAVLDAYMAAGGNVLDTAAVYQQGQSEQKVGDWLRRRAGKQPLIIAKGGHPDAQWRPRLDAAALEADLEQTLRQLYLDAVDIYLLHRDDETRPVEALLEALARIRDGGRAHWVGLSNWRLPRILTALRQMPIDAVSNQFGLGVPAGPPLLPGVVSSFDPATHRLLAEHGIPLLAWSAMSAGFFADPPHASAMTAACAANPVSVERRGVLLGLAAEAGVSPDSILIRWLATAAAHLVPLISSSRPGRVAALMSAANDPHLDEAVATLTARLAGDDGGPLRPLLLPAQVPGW